MNRERKRNDCPQISHPIQETIETIYQDFVQEHDVLLDPSDVQLIDMKFQHEPQMPDITNGYNHRSLFCTGEGCFVFLHMKSSVGTETINNLWNRFHAVKVQTIDDTWLKCESRQLITLSDDEFIIVAEALWYKLDIHSITSFKLHVSLGNAQTTFAVSDYCLFPFGNDIKGKTGTLLLSNVAPDENGKLSPGMRPRKHLTKDASGLLHVVFKGNIQLNNHTYWSKGPELEFRYKSKNGERIYTSIIDGVPSKDGKTYVYHETIDVKELVAGTYLLEVCLMGEPFKSMFFTIQEATDKKVRQPERKNHVQPCTSLQKLNDMVGLTEVKQVIRYNANYMKLMKLRHKAGLSTTGRIMNMIFSGNPGTGKTTVARLIGEILAESGVLSKGHLVECNREMLIDNIVGGTEKKTKEFIDRSKGGVLFIDEGYSLMDGGQGSNDFGQRVIDTLMPVLSDNDSDRIVILAGYEQEMQKLLQTNPGLSSRFPLHLHFPDYSVEELMEMIQLYLKDNDYTLPEKTAVLIRQVVEKASSIRSFGAGRFVHTFIQNIVLPGMATRLMESKSAKNITTDMLKTIEPEDIPDAQKALSQMGMLQPASSKIGFR